MKKITLVVALLGATYFTNAQVGIVTSQPALSSQLEIASADKGVLIPRVRLTDITVFTPIGGTPVESLLVYNIGTTTGVNAVTPGFYYWVPVNGTVVAHWERIVNQTQLDEAISNITDLQGDVSKVIALLKVAFPANNLVDPAVTGDTFGGGMVFTPATTTPAVPAKIEYVYFDGTNYTKKDITTDIINIIKGAESKTVLIKTTDGTKQYYISETYLTANNNTVPAQGVVDAWTTVPAGVYQIDIIGGVSKNIETILDQTTTILLPGSTTQYYTVEEYIQYIASMADGNVVYRNIGTTAAPNWVFQYWSDAANGGLGAYVTINLTDLVGAAQSKTALVKTNTANAPVKQYFISEAYLIANAGTLPAQTVVNGWTPGTLPAGVFEIDIVAGVSTNFESILSQSTTIVKTTTPTTYYTVQEYIELLSQNNLANGVTRIVLNGVGQASFEQWNNTTNAWVAVANTAFSTIVKDNETDTNLKRSTNGAAYAAVTTDPKGTAGSTVVAYEYNSEDGTNNYINVTEDILYSVTNNQAIRNAITNILNAGGNVYFTRTAIAAGTPTGQLAIPADSFYTVDSASGVREMVNIAQTIVNAITNATTDQKQQIKNQLGDTYNTSTVTNTGDTWIDGRKIYAGVYTATVAAGTANVSAITLTLPAGTTTLGKIVSIKLLSDTDNIINTSTTDVALTGNSLSFKIGTGNMYNVLSATNLSVKVVVEFSAQ